MELIDEDVVEDSVDVELFENELELVLFRCQGHQFHHLLAVIEYDLDTHPNHTLFRRTIFGILGDFLPTTDECISFILSKSK